MHIEITMRAHFIILFLIFSSCNDDDVMIIPDYETCNITIPNCNPSEFSPDESSVTPIEVSQCHIDEGVNNLAVIPKRYLWFYCLDVDALVYEDSLGNELELQVLKRQHVMENVLWFESAIPACDIITYESVDENMELELLNEEVNIRFRLVLQPSRWDDYDVLEVNRTTFDDDREYWSNRALLMFLNHFSSEDIVIANYSSASSLSIKGQDYNDVHFNEDRSQEVYYNKSCGLIAFRDDSGVFWKFKDVILKE